MNRLVSTEGIIQIYIACDAQLNIDCNFKNRVNSKTVVNLNRIF